MKHLTLRPPPSKQPVYAQQDTPEGAFVYNVYNHTNTSNIVNVDMGNAMGPISINCIDDPHDQKLIVHEEFTKEVLEKKFENFDSFPEQYSDKISIKEFLVDTFLRYPILSRHQFDVGKSVETFDVPLGEKGLPKQKQV